MGIILRLRSPQGVKRVEVDERESARQLLPHVEAGASLALDPQGTQIINLDQPIGSFSKHGDFIFVIGSREPPNQSSESPLAAQGKHAAVDECLLKETGRQPRTLDPRMCRHGEGGMCEHCQPLEPWDERLLKAQGIKHLSLHSHLRKSNTPLDSLQDTPLVPVMTSKCRHAAWPAGMCSACQPGPVTLRRQPFRMVDHVEFAEGGRGVEAVVGEWRASGWQRFAWLLGTHEPYDGVPLGVKAVIRHIHQPPQDGGVDGFRLLQEGDAEADARDCAAVAECFGWEIVGMLYTDLHDDGSGTGRVQHRRNLETFFLSSPEILFMAKEQLNHPYHPVIKSDHPPTFGSRFVTIVVTGDAEGAIHPTAYQASNQAMQLAREGLMAASTDPSVMLLKAHPGTGYRLDVLFTVKNEYGYDVPAQGHGEDGFPVDYLVVSLTCGFTGSGDAPPSFPAPHLHPSAGAALEHLTSPVDFNLCMYLMGKCGASRTDIKELVSGHGDPFASDYYARLLQSVEDGQAADQGGDAWACQHCTFLNDQGATDCNMCGLPK